LTGVGKMDTLARPICLDIVRVKAEWCGGGTAVRDWSCYTLCELKAGECPDSACGLGR